MSSGSSMKSDEGVFDIATSGLEYEVFLSFRGPDTRSNFTDHLYVKLTDAGIRIYRDDEEIRKGENLGSELLKGIRESKIAIPIFSKGYAASKWCLKELAQIMEYKRSNRLKVMPIFYDVAPSEVRYQTGDYAKAFESHEKYYDENTIKNWKVALRDVGELSDWDIHSGTSRLLKEGELTKEVTKVVLRELKKAYLVITDHLVGVEHHVKENLSLLSADANNVQIIGIYGMGGIGKTTLAKVIYNRLSPNFEKHSFLADIRETSRSTKGMKFLYKRLISDILGKESANISNDDEGINIIRGRFSNKKVVILLDDVDKISQLEGLIGKRNYFGRGSRIIITTRNKSILDLFRVDWSYELGGLETHLALQLFSKHAFRKHNPPKEYYILSQKAVQITAGLPLALEVFGSLLSGKSSKVWDSTLKKLEKVSHQDIRSKLSVTFEALDMQQKQIFLDIACFFNGEDNRILIHYWEESQFPEEAMEVLQEMSLIKIQKDHKLWMHDQLRDLVREIVREEHRELEKCSRLWNEEEATKLFMRNMITSVTAHLKKLLKEAEGSDVAIVICHLGIRLKATIDRKPMIRWNVMGGKDIEGICVDISDEQSHYCLSSDKFTNLPNLRILRVHDQPNSLEAMHFWYRWYSKFNLEDWIPLPRNPFIFFKLRWLSWHNFPGMYKTRNISFENLVILDLWRSSITSSWGGWNHIKMAKKLKVLNLTGCKELVKTPDLSSHLLLEQLILEGCLALVEIDESISMLERLVIINLSECTSLKKLPKQLSCMESLEELDISWTCIVEIPNWPLMRRLRVFDSSTCIDLNKVGSLDFAINITELSLKYSRITILPDSIGRLANLIKLSLEKCRGINTLPESIGNLVSLVDLDLSSSGIVELPDTIGNLKNLETLRIARTPLRALPSTVGMMEKLMSIDAGYCYELTDIPKLPRSLISLEVSGARTPSIPYLSNLVNLKYLVLELVDRPVDSFEAGNSGPWWIKNVTSLETLKLTSECIISLHGDLSMLSHLRTLELFFCTDLQSISKLPSGLTSLKIQYCKSLRTLMDLPSSLTSLEIHNCSSLRTLLDPSHLRNLGLLRIGSTPISAIKGLHSSHESLQGLYLYACECSEINGLDLLENLETLSLWNCEKLRSLPDLSSLKKLKHVEVRSCPNLVEVPGIDMLENLTNLSITDCVKLRSPPKICQI